MRRFLCFVLCLCFLFPMCPTSFAFTEDLVAQTQSDPASTVSLIKEETLVLPSNLTEISEESFAHDYKIKYVVIPDSVVTIADNAFDGIQDLTFIANRGSYAYSWALDHGFLVSEAPVCEDEFTITLTEDNFDEYFELVMIPVYNAFGELSPNECRIGFRSKLYDYGYVITNDVSDMQDIVIEVNYRQSGYSSHFSYSLEAFLGFIGMRKVDEIHMSRMASGNLTFTRLLKSYRLVKIGHGYKDSNSAYVDYYDKDGIVRTVVRNCVVDGYLY